MKDSKINCGLIPASFDFNKLYYSYFPFLAELYINSVFFVKLKFKNACIFTEKNYPSRLKKINNNQDILLTLDFPFILHISKEHMKKF